MSSIALPLKLEGCQLVDGNGVSIALVRGEMAEYRAWGAEIVKAVNTHPQLISALKNLRAAVNAAEQV